MSTSTEDMDYEMSDSEIAVVVFRILIYVIGVIGNLLVIFVILFLKEYKKITHWYVLQMALADIIFLQNLPVKATEDINGRWVNAEWLCSAQQTVLFFTYYASIMFLTIMAIDRYLAVCHPMSETVRTIRSPRNAYIVSIVTWIVALGLSVPAMLYGTLSGQSPNCRCNLIFPTDPRDWCINNGFATASESLNISLEQCMETTFPAVHNDPCFSFEGGFPGASVPEIGLSGNGVNSGDGQTGGSTTTSTGSPGLTDSTNLLFGINEDDLQPQPIVPPSSSDSTNLLFSIDETDLNSLFGGGDPAPVSTDPPASANASTPVISSNARNPQPSTSGTGRVLYGSCFYTPEKPGFISYIYFNFIAMFLIPLLVLIFCYGLIVRRLVGSSISGNSSNGQPKKGTILKSKTPSTASGTTGRSEKEKTKVTILCFLLAALFTICWLPFHSVHLAKVVGIDATEENFCVQLSAATSLIAYAGSAINPYLYNFLGSFKKRVKQIKSSAAMQSLFSGTTKASTAPRTSIPRSSLVPSTDGSRAITPTPAPEEIPLNNVATKL